MNAAEGLEWLTLIENRAVALRLAGVTSLSIDGVTIHLAPPPLPTMDPPRTAAGSADDAALFLDGVPGYDLSPEGGR